MVDLKNLNKVSIYIFPLIDDNLTLDDLSIESGFVNAYTSDKNRPSLENKIFLMYDSSVNTKQSLFTHCKIKKLDTLFSTKYIKINGKHYIVYCFTTPKYNTQIRSLKICGKTNNLDATLEIYRFWINYNIPDMVARLFISGMYNGDIITAELPEEDYYSYKEIGESL